MMDGRGFVRGLALVIVCLRYASTSAQDTIFSHVCNEAIQEVQCDNIIQIESAWYGTGRPKICTTIEEQKGCNVTDSLHKNCTGRSRCKLEALVAYVQCDGGQKPKWSQDFTKHLSLQYKCLKGPVISQLPPCSGSPIMINDTEGYISSWMTSKTGRGNRSCPWVIEAQPGQLIRLDWQLFGSGSANPTDYIEIKDNNKTKQSSSNQYYVSTGGKVTIITLTDTKGKAKANFLLKFNVPNKDNSSSFPVLLVIGIVVGLVVIIPIVIGLVVLIRWRRKSGGTNVSKPKKDEKEMVPLTNGEDRSPTSTSAPKDSIYYASAPVPMGRSPTERELPPTPMTQIEVPPGYADPKALRDSDDNLAVDHTYDEPSNVKKPGPPVTPLDPPPKPKRQPHLSDSQSPPSSPTGGANSPVV